jgi:hypothetical protein
MVGIKMKVAECVNKCAGLEPADLCNHERQEGIGSDVERNTKKEIGAALVELAAEFVILNIKLEQGMTRCEGHEVKLGRVPSGNNETTAIGVVFDVLNHAGHLIDHTSIRSSPITPLGPVDPAKVALFIRPLVPDGHIIFTQVGRVGISLQKPKKLMNNRAQVQLFCGEKRKPLAEVKSLLGPENGVGASASAVRLEAALIEDKAEEAMILLHV